MSPGLDYKLASARGTGAFASPLHGRAGRFYDGTPGRELVACPDCKKPADALFGDHGGECLDSIKFFDPNTALGIVHAHAMKRQRFSMNDLREAFIKAGIAKGSRASAMTAAQKRGWIETDGMVRSTDKATKGHHLHVYRSLIFGTQQRWSR